MWKAKKISRHAAFPLLAVLIIFCSDAILYGQQNIIANKDNTRPEFTRQSGSPARIGSFTAVQNNGYVKIQWSSLSEQDTRKYIVEYSPDGIDYQSAGETIAAGGNYFILHKTIDTRPMLYRLKIETLNGSFYYSSNTLLDGMVAQPVNIFPTTITGNVINVIASFPVERITIFSIGGEQVFAKDVNGQKELMTITIPQLSKGIYLMNFSGQGWRTISKFIVPE